MLNSVSLTLIINMSNRVVIVDQPDHCNEKEETGRKCDCRRRSTAALKGVRGRSNRTTYGAHTTPHAVTLHWWRRRRCETNQSRLEREHHSWNLTRRFRACGNSPGTECSR